MTASRNNQIFAAAGGLLSPEVIAGVQALAASFNLPAEFIAGLDS